MTDTGTFYAHSNILRKENWQPLVDHLKNTADLAFNFGKSAGVSELAHIAGLLHDFGKFSKEFQARLEGNPQRVDHSTADTKELLTLCKGTP